MRQWRRSEVVVLFSVAVDCLEYYCDGGGGGEMSVECISSTTAADDIQCGGGGMMDDTLMKWKCICEGERSEAEQRVVGLH